MILTGGLDLSVPWTIGFSGILLAGIVQGSDQALVYALPIVLGIAVVIGLVNGIGIVVLGLSPIVITLAMNGVLQGAALLYSGGTPAGFSSPLLRWFMTARLWWGVTPVVLFVIAFVIFAGRLPVTDALRPPRLRHRQRRPGRRAVRHRRRPRRWSGLCALGGLRGDRRHHCSPAFPARRASAWATTTCCRRSPWWWSAAR